MHYFSWQRAHYLWYLNKLYLNPNNYLNSLPLPWAHRSLNKNICLYGKTDLFSSTLDSKLEALITGTPSSPEQAPQPPGLFLHQGGAPFASSVVPPMSQFSSQFMVPISGWRKTKHFSSAHLHMTFGVWSYIPKPAGQWALHSMEGRCSWALEMEDSLPSQSAAISRGPLWGGVGVPSGFPAHLPSCVSPEKELLSTWYWGKSPKTLGRQGCAVYENNCLTAPRSSIFECEENNGKNIIKKQMCLSQVLWQEKKYGFAGIDFFLPTDGDEWSSVPGMGHVDPSTWLRILRALQTSYPPSHAHVPAV